VADLDCIIVGAGVAGLAAAAALRDAGRRALVLEASARIGGRAWTAYPEALGHVWFDMGAVWFHDAENNPLVEIARRHGDTLLPSDEIRTEGTFVGNRRATEAEMADQGAAWGRFERKTDDMLRAHGDVAMAAVTRQLQGDPWARSVEAWESSVICAVDPSLFSAQDWRRNALGGSNLVPDGGIGHFVRRRLTAGLDIRCNTPVRMIRWGGANGMASVATDAGTLTAAACIVTVSTGVLGSGILAFDPVLPAAVSEAIAALPMGLANKIAIRAIGTDRLDVPDHCSVDWMVTDDHPILVPLQCWPFGRDYIQAWVGGAIAHALAGQSDAASVDHVMSHLRSLFGARADRLFRGGPSFVTRWHANPWVRGAYSYAVPGGAMARDKLAEPLAGGHLMFAGEACNVPYAGTVAGSWLSGQSAARAVLSALA